MQCSSLSSRGERHRLYIAAMIGKFTSRARCNSLWQTLSRPSGDSASALRLTENGDKTAISIRDVSIEISI